MELRVQDTYAAKTGYGGAKVAFEQPRTARAWQ
jgi:hypothetical protein